MTYFTNKKTVEESQWVTISVFSQGEEFWI